MNVRKTRNVSIVCALTVTLIVFGILGSPSAQAKANYEFTAYEGYEQGLKAGAEANKLILLDFYFDT